MYVLYRRLVRRKRSIKTTAQHPLLNPAKQASACKKVICLTLNSCSISGSCCSSPICRATNTDIRFSENGCMQKYVVQPPGAMFPRLGIQNIPIVREYGTGYYDDSNGNCVGHTITVTASIYYCNTEYLRFANHLCDVYLVRFFFLGPIGRGTSSGPGAQSRMPLPHILRVMSDTFSPA